MIVKPKNFICEKCGRKTYGKYDKCLDCGAENSIKFNVEKPFEMYPHTHIEFDYVNWKGVRGRRRAEVGELYYGSNEYHQEPQFLLEGYDLDKKESRLFAVKDMSNIKKI